MRSEGGVAEVGRVSRVRRWGRGRGRHHRGLELGGGHRGSRHGRRRRSRPAGRRGGRTRGRLAGCSACRRMAEPGGPDEAVPLLL